MPFISVALERLETMQLRTKERGSITISAEMPGCFNCAVSDRAFSKGALLLFEGVLPIAKGTTGPVSRKDVRTIQKLQTYRHDEVYDVVWPTLFYTNFSYNWTENAAPR